MLRSLPEGCLVLSLSREWGKGLADYYWGLYRVYYRDPFLHSLLRRGQKRPRYCYGGYLPQSVIVIPNLDTLHSTM